VSDRSADVEKVIQIGPTEAEGIWTVLSYREVGPWAGFQAPPLFNGCIERAASRR
jgi:hypothetical protein